MSLSMLFLAIFLLLTAVTLLGWVAISAPVLGIVAFVTGILLLVEGYRPLTIWRRDG